MTLEQPPRDALRPLRPLPSIDVPLLREERSALRNRRLVRLAIASSMLVALGVGGAYLARRLGSSAPAQKSSSEPAVPAAAGGDDAAAAGPALAPTTPTAPAPAPDEGPVPQAAGRYEHRFGRAGSFGDALRKAGLPADEADALVAALTGVLDFRRAQPEDLLLFERDAQAQLTRFEYRKSPTLRYEVVRDAGGRLAGRQLQLKVESARVERAGVVEGSLGDALEALELGRALAGVFADVFARKVNFSTDTRRGDSFRVVLDEERVEGEFLRYGTIHALEYRGEKVGLLRAFWHESPQTPGDFFDDAGRALHGGWLRTPVRYDHISSGFGVRMHPVLRRKLMHSGIDYVAPAGTPVRAAAAGSVRFAGRKGANGNLVALTHAQGYESFYCHLSRFAPGIKSGVRVKQQQLIAYVGSTGRSTGPHLHFALKRGHRFIDPNSQLHGPGLPLPSRELPAFKERVRELLAQLLAIPVEQPAPLPAAPPPAPSEEAPSDFDEEEL